MISISDMTYSYPKKQPLFEDMNLQFEQGKIYGLLGKNGMGKSTLLKLIGGYLFPKKGLVKLNGEEPQNRRPHLMEQIFFLSEEFNLPSLSIRQYLAAFSPFYSAFDNARFYNILDELGIDADVKLQQLSYGQKKKFIISFGLATGAKYLIFDEPTNGLDIPSKIDFRKIIAEHITNEQIVIISTHQINDLEHLLDAIAIIDEGKIVMIKEISEIEESVLFTTASTLSESDAVIYHQRIPGGYLMISENKDGQPSKIEIEAFFNAVTQNKTFFSKLLNR